MLTISLGYNQIVKHAYQEANMQNITNCNDNSCWREYEKNQVSHSAAHYLMAINRLRGEFGYARVTDVATRLGVSRGAVSLALGQLRKRDWVTEDPHKFLLLTDSGRKVVKRVERNYGILARFFEEVLGVSPEIAHGDACKMEHLMSMETGQRLVHLMERVLDDPQSAMRLRNAARENTASG
jgi:Mn-dependent DtxR family transcriptional regulator